MAAISSISNGEAMSSVRTKLNSVITEINLLDPTDWIDYSATSTIVGWSVLTTKKIRYRVIGKQVFVYVQLLGTSNSSTTSFTLPFNSNNTIELIASGYVFNNGVPYSTPDYLLTANSNVCALYYWSTISSGGTNFTASGSKGFNAQFFYEIA